MDFSGQLGGARHHPRPEINLVPFIDILLVLLVIFIVASPVLTHAVRLELPRASSQPERHPVDEIRLSILADGTILCDGTPTSEQELSDRFRSEGSRPDPPEVRIEADGRARYEAVARAMAAAARAGLGKIAFVSLPLKQP